MCMAAHVHCMRSIQISWTRQFYISQSRGFASSVIPWQLHGDGGHIGRQLSIGLILLSNMAMDHHHVFFAKKGTCIQYVNNAKTLLHTYTYAGSLLPLSLVVTTIREEEEGSGKGELFWGSQTLPVKEQHLMIFITSLNDIHEFCNP